MWLPPSVRRWLDCHGWERNLGQFVRFSFVGGANTFLDFGVYIVLTRLFEFWSRHIVVANAIAFTCAATSSFVLNTFWTFRCGGQGWSRRFGKFFFVATVGMLINSALLASLTWLGIYDLIAKVAATAVVLAWNFLMQKKWTFKL